MLEGIPLAILGVCFSWSLLFGQHLVYRYMNLHLLVEVALAAVATIASGKLCLKYL
jgi:hypothetical protein